MDHWGFARGLLDQVMGVLWVWRCRRNASAPEGQHQACARPWCPSWWPSWCLALLVPAVVIVSARDLSKSLGLVQFSSERIIHVRLPVFFAWLKENPSEVADRSHRLKCWRAGMIQAICCGHLCVVPLGLKACPRSNSHRARRTARAPATSRCVDATFAIGPTCEKNPAL